MITGFYAGILALIYVGLSFNIILRRVKGKTLFGDNNDPVMTRAVRAHGNFIEYVPFILLMLFMYENFGGSRYIVHAFGLILVIGRALHIWGLIWEKVIGRLSGTVLTQLLMVMLAVMMIVKGIKYMTLVNGPGMMP